MKLSATIFALMAIVPSASFAADQQMRAPQYHQQYPVYAQQEYQYYPVPQQQPAPAYYYIQPQQVPIPVQPAPLPNMGRAPSTKPAQTYYYQ